MWIKESIILLYLYFSLFYYSDGLTVVLCDTLLESQDQIWDENDQFRSINGIKYELVLLGSKWYENQDQNAWSEKGSYISYKDLSKNIFWSDPCRARTNAAWTFMITRPSL